MNDPTTPPNWDETEAEFPDRPGEDLAEMGSDAPNGNWVAMYSRDNPKAYIQAEYTDMIRDPDASQKV